MKKLLSCILAVGLGLGMFSVTASADQITESAITIRIEENECIEFNPLTQSTMLSGNGWTYEPGTPGTLILNEFDGEYIGIYRAGNIVLELQGNNNVCSDLRILNGGNLEECSGIIIGDGTLSTDNIIFGADVTINSGKIVNAGEVSITHGTTAMLGGTLDTKGIKVQTILHVLGGVICTVNTSNYGFGIQGNGDAKLLIDGGVVTAQGEMAGIWWERGKTSTYNPALEINGVITGGDTADDNKILTVYEGENDTSICLTVAESQIVVGEGYGYLSWAESSGAAKYVNIVGETTTTSADNRETEKAIGIVGSFVDVSTSAYYAEAVSWAVDNNITAGTGSTTFSPDQTCTTVQILTFLWRANGSPTAAISNVFTDISTSDYYYEAALWAYENGLISGTSFDGDTPCTRSATVAYFWKLFGSPSASISNFTDVASDADYASAVNWAVEQGITNGTSDTTFSPDATCTRGQIVTFLYRYIT